MSHNDMTTAFSERDKAAILLLSMGEESAAKILRLMEPEEVKDVSMAMARLSNVSSIDAQQILQQFFEQYTQQSGISRASREYLEKSLDMALGRKLASGMLDSIYGDVMSNDIQRLQWLPADVLARFFRHEHLQMQAVMLVFLPPDTANAVLKHLPLESHDELIYRIANLEDISDHVINDLRVTLQLCIDFVAEQSGAKVDGSSQAANILNRYSGDKANLIELVEMHNVDTANAIRDNMFNFMILGRQPLDILQALIEAVPNEVLATALKGADKSIINKIEEALPKRMAEALNAEIQRLGPMPLSKIEVSRTEVMAIARRLFESGELQLQLFEEQVVS